MKAAVVTNYGGPENVVIKEVPTPSPGPRDVLVKVRATTVSAADWRLRSGTVPKGFGVIMKLIFGWSRPRQPILGSEFAGEIVAVGSAVTRFAVGDAVVAYPDISLGGHAEYKAMPETGLIVRKPARLSFEQAAAIGFGGLTALQFLRRGGIKKGDSILVNGASGSVGHAAVQLAKHFGADVTGVASAGNAELVRSAGADLVIDYAATDFSQTGKLYDFVMDCVGNADFDRVEPILKPGGRLLQVVAGLPELLRAPLINRRGSKKVIGGTVGGSLADLQLLADLAAEGRYLPHIERSYALSEIVAAHAHVETGRKRGNIAVLP